MKLKLDEFLNIYKWEEKYSKSNQRRLDWFWSFDLDISLESLWSFISDTSRLNKAMGLSELNFEEKDGVLYGKSKTAGISLEWVEVPWTWIYADHLISIREYSKGIAYTAKVVFHFEKISEKSTRFYIYLGWIPRNIFYKLLLVASEKSIFKKYETVLADIVKISKVRNFTPSLPSRELVSLIENQSLLAKIKLELEEKSIPEDLILKLIDYIEFGNDLDLYRIRVLELASKWKVNDRELIILCMYATRAGLLSISWDIICPHCRGARLETTALYDIPNKGSCDVCDIDFENDSENSIEITFHVHPSIRNVPKIFFCSAEPAKKPHIRFQKQLEPFESLDSKLNLPVGEYLLRVKGDSKNGNLTMSESESPDQVNWVLGENENYQLSTKNPKIHVENKNDYPRLITIEALSWDPFILKPAYLFSFQEFHDLFSAESLSSDIKLELGMQTVFFTDIVGSSTLYENFGDSKTFAQVKKHFEEINIIVKKNHGAIIKTIGDAVMATFPSPEGAIQAAMTMQEVFDGKGMNGIILRISIHYGQCIAVNLNSGIDFFGKTVNIAAKIQKLANASQIVFTQEYKQNPNVQFFLESNKIELEKIEYSIPGMKDEFTIFRINVRPD